MPKKESPPETQGGDEGAPILVSLMDFNAGHYPGLKPPPLCLNEIFRGNHPELTAKIDECYLNLTSGEQSQIVFSVELNDKDEKVLIDVRVFKKPGQPDYPILFGWPRSKKYYDT